MAHLDPLGINIPKMSTAPELDYKNYGFKESDLNRTFYLGSGILIGFSKSRQHMTLREILDTLQKVYCGSIGIEYAHIPDRRQCDWLRSRVEVPERYNYTKENKTMILDRLLWSDSFEKFVSTKFPSEKRFGLEGAEALIPGMKAMVRTRTIEPFTFT